MLNKIYLAVLAVSIGIMVFFTYYSWSWLQSIGVPVAALEGYAYHANLAWAVLWLSSVLLLILANAILWKNGKAVAIWVTFLYFAVFVLVWYFWLDQSYFQFKKANGLWDGSFSVGPIFGVILVVIAGVVVFADQFVVLRLAKRMYPDDVVPEVAEPVATEE